MTGDAVISDNVIPEDTKPVPSCHIILDIGGPIEKDGTGYVGFGTPRVVHKDFLTM